MIDFGWYAGVGGAIAGVEKIEPRLNAMQNEGDKVRSIVLLGYGEMK